jgi:accessory gene regulator B
MIENVASLIVEILIRHNIIKVQQAEVYQYGLEILISSLLTCCVTFACGLLFRCLAAALLYFLMFAVLRSICGGYHAKTYWQCNLVFSFVTSVVLIFFRWMPVEQFTELHYCSVAIAILTTAFCTPVENDNKPLTDKQKKHFRVLGTVMVVLLALISCLLIHFYQSSYSVLIDMTLLAVSISAFVTELRRGGDKGWQK